MELKSQFDPEDWKRIGALPMLVGMAVTAADPGGLWGAIKESTAMSRALIGGRPAGGNALVDAVVAGFATAETRSVVTDLLRDQVRGKQPAQVVDGLVAEIGRLSALVASKAPDQAPGLQGWLMEIARNVAEAGTEGGFLGFGGVKVSEAEKATLDRLAEVLGPGTTAPPGGMPPPPVA